MKNKQDIFLIKSTFISMSFLAQLENFYVSSLYVYIAAHHNISSEVLFS